MIPKPKHLGPEYASQFQDESVLAVYKYRPVYPPATFDIVSRLVVGAPRTVLDVGCGTGYVARNLIAHVDRIDALDISPAMVDAARKLPNGDHAGINWIVGSAETTPVSGSYGLITAAASLHWMDWSVVLPRFKLLLRSGARLALVNANVLEGAPWKEELPPIFSRFSTNQDFQPYNLVDLLTERNLFQVEGEEATEPVMVRQSVADYVESIHARNGFSRDRMDPSEADAFDRTVTGLLHTFASNGFLNWPITGHVVWGFPR